MAGAGPTPKTEHQRERDTKRRQSDAQTVVADGTLRGPELFGVTDARTLAWYATWRTSAQAVLFADTDWQRLSMLAPLVESYFRSPTKDVLAEIRLNESSLGATYADRLRARIRIAPSEDGPDATVTALHVVSDKDAIKAQRKSKKPAIPAPDPEVDTPYE